ncbi:HlyD family secretion protein, partial [Escherichia coli]|nr:HlyD family secretion protein [Escherichia coli]
MIKKRALWIVPPLVVGVAIAAMLVSRAGPPARVEHAERQVTARVTVVAPTSIRPVVHGFAEARPAQQWDAVAEVAGTITYRHPDLETGNLIAAGTQVLTIDPARYQANLAQVQADI